MDVEIQDAWSVHMTRLPELIKHIKRFTANLEKSNNESTKKVEENYELITVIVTGENFDTRNRCFKSDYLA